MSEQDILKKIKESADGVEIPESLKPEKIETMLKDNQGKEKRFRWKASHLVATAAVLALLLGALPVGLLLSSENEIPESASTNEMSGVAEAVEVEEIKDLQEITAEVGPKQDAGDMYLVAKSEEEVYTFLEENYDEYYSRYFYGLTNGAVMEEAKETADGTALSAEPDEAAEKLSYSTTNLQMAGVDESDIVKTNGTHIFVVADDQIKIVEASNGKMKQVGSILPKLSSFTDCVQEMYVDDDKLMLIVQQCEENMEKTGMAGGGSGYLPLQENSEICYDMAYNVNTSISTILYTYDISNPASPKQIGSIRQDGTYKTSRKIGDLVYLFTIDSIERNTIPRVGDVAIPFDSIYLPNSVIHGLVISSISTEKPNEVVDNTLIFNDYVEIYVSSNAIYLYNSNYTGEQEVTEIAKFSLNNGRISATAAATVPGTVRDTFAINEYGNELRVLTTLWDSDARANTNQLYILDKNLNPEGSIKNIAQGEQIYAARYFGDLVYFITYRNMDPLFVADLSDSKNPKILGELEITGYSDYLHPWGEDKLLGIGYETDPKDSSREGIKLVMFDISNPGELSILDTVVLKNADYSAALYDYKSVLADAGENIIGFTTTQYNDYQIDYHVYSFENGKFKEQLTFDVKRSRIEEDCRGLYIGDYFYFVNEVWMGSFNRKGGYKAVDELEFY